MVGTVRSNLPAVLFVLSATLFAQVVSAASFSVSPLRLELSAATPVAVVEVGNASAEPVTVQAQSRTWSQRDGADEYGEGRPFIVSPTIFTIPAGGKQVVRVALRGAPPRDVEAAYRLVMTEIPPAQPDRSPGLRVALRMDMAVYVSPQQPGAQPDASFALDLSTGTPRIAVKNSGKAHFRMVDVAVSSGASLHAELPVLVVLPGATRYIDLPKAKADGQREFGVKADSNAGPIDLIVRHAP
jgi:fimbrial chaperone protein